jgi:hypothetical protein
VFRPSGADAILVTTGTDGVARGVLTTDDDGTSTIVAEISPPGTNGSFRGPGTADDECEQQAGANGVPAAGNCVSHALTVHWEGPVNGHECDDGIDNDGDGFIDYGDDPSCTSEDDGEEPFDEGTEAQKHDRSIAFRFRDLAGERRDELAVSGRVRVPDGFSSCARAQEIRIQRRVDGQWVTRVRVGTDSDGRFESVIPDRPGRYRAVARHSEVFTDDEEVHICRRGEKVKRHRHRG